MTVIVAEFKRKYSVDFVRRNNEVNEIIIKIIGTREINTGKKVKEIRLDNPCDFTNEQQMKYY